MIDLAGKIFGRWTVLNYAGSYKGQQAKWLCRCICGAEKTVTSSSLRRGKSTSCGCFHREMTRNLAKGNTIRLTHGHTRNGKDSPTFRSWKSMLERCENPKHVNFDLYGGRGIKICPEWHEFLVFLSEMGERPQGLTLDRKDSNGGYSKSNCRWATYDEQNRSRSKRPRALLTWSQVIQIRDRGSRGEIPLDLAREFGVSRCSIYSVLSQRSYRYPLDCEIGVTDGR
jgi:hypothetical protein